MRALAALLALAPAALFAYAPQFSRGGYFPAEGSPRAVASMNVG